MSSQSISPPALDNVAFIPSCQPGLALLGFSEDPVHSATRPLTQQLQAQAQRGAFPGFSEEAGLSHAVPSLSPQSTGHRANNSNEKHDEALLSPFWR